MTNDGAERQNHNCLLACNRATRVYSPENDESSIARNSNTENAHSSPPLLFRLFLGVCICSCAVIPFRVLCLVLLFFARHYYGNGLISTS
jgi:hypothetical protein